jgi:lipid II:glycine glycyltransferase (peptidoglycan interpeptide bridge formation enzyme)
MTHPERDIHVSTAVPEAAWNEFLESIPDGHHLQTSCWAGVKASGGWKTERIVALGDGRIVGGMQMLYRELSRWLRVAYVPRGPVIAKAFAPVAQLLMRALIQTARRLRISYLTVQPPQAGAGFVKELEGNGFIVSPMETAPTTTILIDVQQPDEVLLGDMRKSVRRALRKAHAGPLNVRVGTEADLPVFHSLMAGTAHRQGFSPWPLDHLRTVWQQFAPSNHIVLFLAEKEGVPVAGELEITFGDTLVSKRSGWSGEYAKEHPSELLIWNALLWARQRGLKWFDMEGFDRRLALALQSGQEIPMEHRLNHHWFKAGFGGKIVILLQNYERVFLPMAGWIHRQIWGRFFTLHLRHTLITHGRSLMHGSLFRR